MGTYFWGFWIAAAMTSCASDPNPNESRSRLSNDDQDSSKTSEVLQFNGLDEWIEVAQGQVLGYFHRPTRSYSFKGIPYAQAPVGKLRWKAPLPALSWQGARDATRFGPPCTQKGSATTSTGKVKGQEDCLTLNVYTPEEAGRQELLPVVFWIHGGGNAGGSSGEANFGTVFYDGSYLAQKGRTVVVTVNYRLGPLGFIAHPQLSEDNLHGSSGNYGILDIIQALKWVQTNIQRFGGDPQRVAIAGESAGGANVIALLISPLAKGLFSSAIVQSGFPVSEQKTEAQALTHRLGSKVGCKDSNHLIDCLRKVDAQKLVDALPMNVREVQDKVNYTPVVDGYVIPHSSYQSFSKGLHNQVPLILGTMEDEMNFLLPLLWDKIIVTEWSYRSYIKESFGDELGKRVLRSYPSHRHWGARGALARVLGDAIFHCPAREMLRLLSQSQTAPVYRYVFTHVSDKLVMKPFGATHALDIPYVFGIFPRGTFLGPSQREMELSSHVMNYWTSLAAEGDPNTKNQSSDLFWKPYQAHRDNYLDLNIPVENKETFRKAYCDFWDQNPNIWHAKKLEP